ncbi:TPA: hypothetical protein N0F65_004471 [Lagenidium giganteum]|uniref:Uncharacterized protein n=1 Tax=Lagenidium giganteum TaxID=4803 RepID=A0AAV2ZDM6_9STRA|nr:TPA: hypothetical protein N0F65_004444 [Lagenidium giganteum]DBA04834.1 TPA: hypothetical protein N0F65_004471 [Lagenidium giganteum]
MAFTKTAVVALAALSCIAAQEEVITGGWQNAEVTEENTQLLATALGNKAFYAPQISKPLCLKHVISVKSQVVSGTNYLFTAVACPVKEVVKGGKCVDVNCRAFPFEVSVYSQPWTNTLKVNNISPLE